MATVVPRFLVAFSIALVGCAGESPSGTNVPTRISGEFLRKQQECERSRSLERSRFSLHLDYGSPARSTEGPTVWRPKKTFLGATCFVANAGPVYYIGDGDQKLAQYAINVEHVVVDSSAPGGLSYLVLFSREIVMGELPADIDRIGIDDVVSYDVTTRKVRFNVGRNRHEYQLPAV